MAYFGSSKNPVAPLRGRGLKQEFMRIINTQQGRSLTGAWIETVAGRDCSGRPAVAPLRGRGLKQGLPLRAPARTESLPYGGVD